MVCQSSSMKTFLFGLLVFGVLSTVAQASCPPIYCYDQCTGRYLLYKGNKCGLVFNPLKGCKQAYAICDEGTGPQCRSIRCWDPCSHTTLTFPNANVCSTT